MKRITISLLIIAIIVSLGIIGSKYFNKNENLNNDNTLISYYIETGEGTGVYEKQEGTTWPEGYVLNEEKSSCDNGSTLSWDSSTNSVVVTTNKEDNCKVYMDVKEAYIAVDYIESLLINNPNTMNNDDPGGNVRYMGANPNNYVRFNDELWRIIGIFDIKSSTNGQAEKRVKLIRDESIGNYSWDSSLSTVNNGYGVNEWSQADIMSTLNSGAYWNRSSGACYNGASNATTTCNFSNIGLTLTSKELIDNAVWNTGTLSRDWKNLTSSTTAIKFYDAERSSNNGKICSDNQTCNDSVTRTTLWVGKVGLMYPSDYGYATSGGSTTNRQVCLDSALYNWNSLEISDCVNNDWLYNNNYQWTMTPLPRSSISYDAFFVRSTGYIDGYGGVRLAYGVRPVVYLKAAVKITSGDGTHTNPYTLDV